MTADPVAVVGLDLSLSATGVAYADGATATVRPKPATMRGGARLAHLRDRIAPAFLVDGKPVDLVVVEDYAPGSIGLSGKLANATLRGVVELAAHEAGVDLVAYVKPNTLKLWATGNGAAKKDRMVAAAQADGWRGDPKHDDEADAFHLRALGLQFLRGGGTDARLAVCHAIAWPST